MADARSNGAAMTCRRTRHRHLSNNLPHLPWRLAGSREPTPDDEDPVSAAALVRWFRRWSRLPLPGEARDQVVLVSHVAGATGRPGAGQQADRCTAGPDWAGGSRPAGAGLRVVRGPHL